MRRGGLPSRKKRHTKKYEQSKRKRMYKNRKRTRRKERTDD
jgi:hypothetical protein